MQNNFLDEMMKEENRLAEKNELNRTQPNLGKPQFDASSSASCIAGIAVVVFFIADVIAMIWFSKTKPSLTAACLGLLFLVFGLAAVKSIKLSWDNWLFIIFPIVGFLLTALPIFDFIYKKNTGETIFTERYIIFMSAAAFSAAGVLMMIMPLLKRHFMLKKCTETVIAECVYLDSHRTRTGHGYTRVYAPKWKYVLGGTVYEHQENVYSNVHVPAVGDEQEILVDPYEPQRIYRSSKRDLIKTFIIGAVLVVSGITIFLSQ